MLVLIKILIQQEFLSLGKEKDGLFQMKKLIDNLVVEINDFPQYGDKNGIVDFFKRFILNYRQWTLNYSA